jgi:RHS repeat-associated protein
MVATRYAWDPEFDCITKETDASTGAINVRYTQEPRTYGGLISQRRGSATRYYHYDNIGTTRAVTNQAGSPTDRTTYTAFGELVDSTGTTANPFGFVGAKGYYVDAAQCLYIRARTYCQITARWSSRDPLGTGFGQLNFWLYCKNKPTLQTDPSGLLSCQPPLYPGANYVAGRGRFTLGYPFLGNPASPGSPTKTPWDSKIPKPKIGEISPVYFFAKWEPFFVNFYSNKGCCCCDRIGWVQIEKSTFSFGGYLWWWFALQVSGGWQLDGTMPAKGGINNVANDMDPCGSSDESILLYDRPRYFDHGEAIYLLEWDFQAETCVYCIKGTEGLAKPDGFNGGITVYDCARWGFNVKKASLNGVLTTIIHEPVPGPPKETEGWLRALDGHFPHQQVW